MEASVTEPGQGAAQTPAGVQGEPTAQEAPRTDGFWGQFPNVPDEQRPLLEPHLKNVQGYVTQMEQQLAPFKPLLDMGADPQSIQGLVQFAQSFETNPLQTWLSLARNLQESGQIDSELDLEQLTAVATGQAIEEEDVVSGEPEVQGEVPPWAQAIMDEQRRDREERQRQTQDQQKKTQDRLLARSLNTMKEQLKAAGVPETGLPTDELLTATLLTSRGNPAKAVEALTGFRQGAVQNFVEGRQDKEGQELDMPRGAPKSRATKSNSGDPYKQANVAAEQMLRQNQAGAAREG